MKSYYEIDSAHNLILKGHRGKLAVDDEIEVVNAILADPKYKKGMGAFCDLTEASVNWSLEELDRFRVFVARIKSVCGKSRWGIHISPGKDNTTARMFAALHDAFEDTITVKLFEDREEALKWVKGK
ncbi:MAG: hypothetical protein AB1644_05965 [Candidatus Zixiibacteriota bacterium]